VDTRGRRTEGPLRQRDREHVSQKPKLRGRVEDRQDAYDIYTIVPRPLLDRRGWQSSFLRTSHYKVSAERARAAHDAVYFRATRYLEKDPS